MAIRNITSVIIILSIFVNACTQNKTPGGKLWFYTHSTGNKDVLDTSITPASFIDLQKDGTYTSDLGHFESGKWIYSNNQLFFTSNQNKKYSIPVIYLTAKEMQTGQSKGPLDNFESQPFSIAQPATNPFSEENNKWRIKAREKETDAQIKSRLLNHFRFWELYFTWALNDNVQYIDVRSTPTPIKIYGNGFGLKPFEQLPSAWVNYFFDEEDCQKSNNKIKQLFDDNSIAWPHTENKYKMFISAFQQMQQKLR